MSTFVQEKKSVGRPPGHRLDQVRISQPPWLNPALMYGFGFIPRRVGTDFDGSQTQLFSLDYILALARLQPLKVLSLLPDVVPEVGKAVWNDLRLGCGIDAVRLKAMTTDKSGKKIAEATDGTEAIKQLYTSQPQEVGTLNGILGQNFLMTQFSGMCAVEAVLGKQGTGVKYVFPIDTLTTRFRRDKDTGLVTLWQRMRVYDNPVADKQWGGFIPMPMERTFWSCIDPFPTDPYGRAPMSPVLEPVLEAIAFIRDLMLAWHRVGCPRIDVGFDYEMHARIAKEIIGLSDKHEIEQYVEDEYNRAIDLFKGIYSDDAFFHDIKSEVNITGSGGQWPNVQEIYNIIRWRLIVALKQMPTLMGVVEGNTETWSSVDWQIYAKGLETLVQVASKPLVDTAQLHLQLLGMPYTVQAEYSPVRANQRMVDAQSEQIELDNEITKVYAGFQTQDEASMRVTGSAAVAPMDKEALGVKQVQKVGADGSNQKQTGTKGPSKSNKFMQYFRNRRSA